MSAARAGSGRTSKRPRPRSPPASDPLRKVAALASEEHERTEEDEDRDYDGDHPPSFGGKDRRGGQIIRAARAEDRVAHVLHQLDERIQEGNLLRPFGHDPDRLED